MKQVLQYRRSGATRVVEVPAPLTPDGGILVQNQWSLISPGTERMLVEASGSNLLNTARQRPDLVRQVLDKAARDGIGATFEAVRSRLDVAIALGYSCAGTVLDVGPRVQDKFQKGDRVACAGAGQANHAEVVAVAANLAVRVPDRVSLDEAAFVTVGAIALQGVRIADIRIGETCVVIGLGLVGVYAFVALAVSFLPLHDPLQISTVRLAAPTADHPFGTDALGRDLLSRVLYGARLSMEVAVLSVAGATAAGGVLGLLSGYFGGLADLAIGRAMDIFFAFPAILLALGIVAALGPDPRNVVIAIAVVYTPIFVRVVRGPVLSLKHRDFVEAARTIGATPARVIGRHIVPNLLSTVVVQVSLALSWAVLTEGALSFLGLSAQPPAPSWGVMLNEGRQYLEFATHLAIFPGLAIMIAVLGFNLLGDGLRDALDPEQR